MFSYRLDDDSELRPFTRRQAERVFELIHVNRPHLRAWLPWVDSTDSVAAMSDFVSSAERQLATDDGFHAMIMVGSDVAGMIGFHGVDWGNRSASLGYWLGKEYVGRGLMTRASRAMVHHALCELELERVEIQCAVGNQRSRAIPERLGFATEGTRRRAEQLYGRYVDLVVYAMLASDWICAEPSHGAGARLRRRRSDGTRARRR